MSRGAGDVVVVGGGVIGLSVAYVLAGEGVGVTVLDRSAVGREASWAGAGIISPGSENPPRSPSSALRTLSARLHEEWSRALLEETGLDNGYRRSGGVDVALDAEDDHDLRSSAGRWRLEGIAFERLSPRDFSRVEPALSSDLLCAYYLPDRAQIRNPRHLKALESACVRRGVSVRPGCPALGFSTRNGQVEAVQTSDGPLPCGQVIVCAGAWTEGLLAGVGPKVPTPPVLGQMVLLKSRKPVLRRIVEHGTRYLVPRDDGRVLVGSTEESVGFEARTTAEGVLGLLQEALLLCPALKDAEVERSWSGLRPGSLDHRPYLGLMPGHDNLFVASGHKRAGLQLSTGTASVMADLVQGRTPAFDLTPFALGREPGTASDDLFRS